MSCQLVKLATFRMFIVLPSSGSRSLNLRGSFETSVRCNMLQNLNLHHNSVTNSNIPSLCIRYAVKIYNSLLFIPNPFMILWYMIYLLTAIGLSLGGSITVNIYKENTYSNTKNNRTTQITTNLEECGPCPVFANYTLTFALELRKKQGKTSDMVRKTSVRVRKTSVRI